jgi:hypothetical protein
VSVLEVFGDVEIQSKVSVTSAIHLSVGPANQSKVPLTSTIKWVD